MLPTDDYVNRPAYFFTKEMINFLEKKLVNQTSGCYRICGLSSTYQRTKVSAMRTSTQQVYVVRTAQVTAIKVTCVVQNECAATQPGCWPAQRRLHGLYIEE